LEAEATASPMPVLSISGMETESGGKGKVQDVRVGGGRGRDMRAGVVKGQG
jgi:hypothetical protein